jgi:hypothetical protein
MARAADDPSHPVPVQASSHVRALRPDTGRQPVSPGTVLWEPNWEPMVTGESCRDPRGAGRRVRLRAAGLSAAICHAEGVGQFPGPWNKRRLHCRVTAQRMAGSSRRRMRRRATVRSLVRSRVPCPSLGRRMASTVRMAHVPVEAMTSAAWMIRNVVGAAPIAP